MVVLQHDQNVMSNPEQALNELAQWMENAHPDYYSFRDIAVLKESENLKSIVNSQKEGLELQGKAVKILDSQVNALDQKIREQERTISSLRSQLDEYKEIIKEQEYVIDSFKTAQSS